MLILFRIIYCSIFIVKYNLRNFLLTESSLFASDIEAVDQTKFGISRLGGRSLLRKFAIFSPFVGAAFT